MIKFISLCLISFSLININNKRSGDTMNKCDKKSSFESCIKLREKVKILNLKCEDILQEKNDEKEKTEKSFNSNFFFKELIKPKFSNLINIRETNNYVKKINKKDKVKLMNLVKSLKDIDSDF